MKKGFTLIELLAVIVILAVIALIATPIVLNIINETKESAVLRSADFYLDAVENEIMLENMKQGGSFNPNVCNIDKDGNAECDNYNTIEIKVDGEKPSGGSITFEDGKVTDVTLTFGDKTVSMNSKGQLVLGDTNILDFKSFAEDSWETIAVNVRTGDLSKYKVGDTKEIELIGFTNKEPGSNVLYTIRIANTSTPEECSTEGFSQTACGFVIEFEDIITLNVMNPTGEYKGTYYNDGWNVDGYPASAMYTYIQNDIYNALPEELKKNIIDTKVVSGYGSGDAPNKESIDKLYLLSPSEIWNQGTSNTINYDTARDVTRQLDYYNNSGAKKKYNGSDDYWWLRSANSSLINDFYAVDGGGVLKYDIACTDYGVSVAFRIG